MPLSLSWNPQMSPQLWLPLLITINFMLIVTVPLMYFTTWNYNNAY